MQAIVRKAHKSNYPNPIFFNKGDLLNLGHLDTEFAGWIRTTTKDGNEGWAPVEYIEIGECRTKGVAKCNYNAFELDVEVGESLTVLAELNEWVLAVNAQGNEGWVPLKNVRIN